MRYGPVHRREWRRVPTDHVALVSDTSTDLPQEIAQELGIALAPLGYDLGGRHFLTTQQTPAEFHNALAESTARVEGVPADEWEAAMNAAATNATDLICVVQSVGSSFSRVSAEVAVRRLQNAGKRVEIISPGRSTLGLAALLVAAARKARDGASTDEVFKFLEEGSGSCDTYAVPGSLDYLERTGDLTIFNSQSNIGPIDHGLPIFRVRGRVSAAAVADDAQVAIEEIVRKVGETAAGRPVVLVVAGADPAGPAGQLADAARQSLTVSELVMAQLGPAVGSVLGPGSFALGFCALSNA